ncbi:MAG: hypothetical protein QXQ77_03230 [Candidatus Aenigmatarchaeota archaeon]
MYILTEIKKYIQKCIIRISERWVIHILKYPYSLLNYASKTLYPETYVCKRCLYTHHSICALSSPTRPFWWIKYLNIKNLEKDCKKGVKDLKIYFMSSDAHISSRNICKFFGDDLTFYYEISPKDFKNLFFLELYQVLK